MAAFIVLARDGGQSLLDDPPLRQGCCGTRLSLDFMYPERCRQIPHSEQSGGTTGPDHRCGPTDPM